ncbi:MAG: 5'/3'-nucleotidase SurE [Prevotellaceae bacterium]|nr:5'/3'-nucleotidase SurE [Prevotellaceae bacterium]
MSERKLILVTNDDGYLSEGIAALTAVMRRLGSVIVVAPEASRSGAACSLTSASTVRLREVSEEEGLRVVACTGTPVDCVKLALERVCPRMPDLVVSGINHGDNASISAFYSGTLGACLEACIQGARAVAFSLQDFSRHCDFSPFLAAVERVASLVLRQGLPKDVCLNVNFPVVPQLKGIRVARMARGQWQAEWEEAHHPRGERHYWLSGSFTDLEPEAEDTDYWALRHGYASVTPIQLDNTAYSAFEALSSL